MLVFKHNKDFTIEEVASEIELGVQNPSSRKRSIVKIYRIYIKGKLQFTAMDLTSAYHFIYAKSGYDKFITEKDFYETDNKISKEKHV